MKVTVLTDGDLTTIEVDDQENYLPSDQVMIGFLTRITMSSQDFLPREKCAVAEHCRLFMIEAYKYAISHLPVHDPVVRHAEVLRFDQRHNTDFDSLLFFVEKYPPLKAKLEGQIDTMFDQFTDYQGLDDTLADDFERVDQMWRHHLGNLQGCDGLRFNLLFEVVKYILLLPYSNAEEERIFSIVAKNKTKFKASLSVKTTIPSILSCKVNCFNHTECFKFEPSQLLLENAKKATTRYNADQGQSSNA